MVRLNEKVSAVDTFVEFGDTKDNSKSFSLNLGIIPLLGRVFATRMRQVCPSRLASDVIAQLRCHMAMHHSLTPVVVAGHNEPALVMIAVTLSTLRTLATVPTPSAMECLFATAHAVVLELH